MTYMASCGNTPCNEFDPTGAEWFKIDELGKKNAFQLMLSSPAKVDTLEDLEQSLKEIKSKKILSNALLLLANEPSVGVENCVRSCISPVY